MSKKAKKRIIDAALTVLILLISFGISILFQKFDVWEQITTLFAFSVFLISKDVFENNNRDRLTELTQLENTVDGIKKELTSSHFSRLREGNCSLDVSPYYSSAVAGLERVADHLVNVGYSIVNPVGSQKDI